MDEKSLEGIKKNFGKLPHWVIDCGVLSKLSGSETKVLCELVRQADYAKGIGHVSNERIAKETGVTFSSIPTCIKNLSHAGVIKTWRRGWKRYYQLSPNFDPPPEGYNIFDKRRDKHPKKLEVSRDPKTGQFIGNE